MWGLNDVLTHSIAYGMGEEEAKAKAEMEKKKESPWHTGTPTEEGDYLCAFKMTDNSVEYGWCDWSDGAWDLLCDNDPSTGTCVLVAWQKITPYEGEEVNG